MAGNVALVMDILARDKASKTLDSVGGSADKTGKKFHGLGETAKAAMALGGIAVVAFAKGAISAASDVNESQSKVNTVFGQSSKVVDQFASTAANKLGQSKGAVLEAAGTFGNLFVALGLTQDASAKMSTSAVQLATDLGSFNNASAPEALEAIKSGLLGEAEPLKKFGVNLSAARINAEAFAIGLAKPVKNAAAITAANNKITAATQNLAKAQKEHGKTSLEAKLAQDSLARANAGLEKAMQGVAPPLTAAQKAQAAYSVILKDTKVAQGDFTRTSSGMANQTKIAQARFDDLQASIGAKLLPVMNKAIEMGLKTADWLQKNHKIVVPLVAVFGTLVGIVWAITTAARAYTAVQAALNIVLSANPIGLVVLAIAALAAGLIYAYKHSETFRNIVNGAFTAISTAASFMWDKVLKPTFKFIIGAWLTVTGAILHGAALAFGWVPGIGPKLKQSAKEFDKFRDQVNASIDGIHKNVHVQVDAYFAAYGANAQGVATNAAAHGRASGGPVTAGRPYIVGEHEPELFVPGATGRIYNSRQIAGVGGGGVVIQFNGMVTDPIATGREIERVLTRLRRERGTSLGFA